MKFVTQFVNVSQMLLLCSDVISLSLHDALPTSQWVFFPLYSRTGSLSLREGSQFVLPQNPALALTQTLLVLGFTPLVLKMCAYHILLLGQISLRSSFSSSPLTHAASVLV